MDLCSLVDVRQFLSLDGNDQSRDALLSRLISAASARLLRSIDLVLAVDATVPADLAGACIELAAYDFSRSKRSGVASQSLEGQSLVFLTQPFPPAVQAVVESYRTYNV